MDRWQNACRHVKKKALNDIHDKNNKQNFYLHFSFSNGSCNVGVFDTLWWWWWCWFDASWCKWFKLLLPDDMRPVIADDTLTADATESCKLWWLCKWSVALPLFVPGTKSCRHSPCASDILWSPRSILPNWYWIFRPLSVEMEKNFFIPKFFANNLETATRRTITESDADVIQHTKSYLFRKNFKTPATQLRSKYSVN